MKSVVKKTSILLVIALMLALSIVSAASASADGRGPRIIGDYTIPVDRIQGRYYYSPNVLNDHRTASYIADEDGSSASRLIPAPNGVNNPTPVVQAQGRVMMAAGSLGTQRSARVRALDYGAAQQSMLNMPADKLQQRHELAAELYGTRPSLEDAPRTARRVIGQYTSKVIRRGRYYYTGQDKFSGSSPVFIGETKKRSSQSGREFSVGGYAARYREASQANEQNKLVADRLLG